MGVVKLESNTAKLAEGVHFASHIKKYIVRTKLKGRISTLAAIEKKENAEDYLSICCIFFIEQSAFYPCF